MNWVSQGEGGFCCLLCGEDSRKFALRTSEIFSLSEIHTRKISVHLGRYHKYELFMKICHLRLLPIFYISFKILVWFGCQGGSVKSIA